MVFSNILFGSVEAVMRTCSIKIVFKIFTKVHRETPSMESLFREYTKGSMILKTSIKKFEVMFLICKSINIQYTAYIEIKQKISFGQNKHYKKWIFFLFRTPTHYILHLIRNSSTSWSTWFISLNPVLYQTIFMIQFVWITISFQIFVAFTLSYKLFIPSS